MRRFYLKRTEDHSGVSGTGIVVEGVLFTNGHAALTWLTHLEEVLMAKVVRLPAAQPFHVCPTCSGKSVIANE